MPTNMRRGFRSNFEAFEDFVRVDVGMPASPPPFAAARVAMYKGKLMNLLWFEGEFPDNPNQEFIYSLNEDWPNPSEFPGSWKGLSRLSLQAKKYLCRRLKRPAWIDRPRTFHNRWTYAEFTAMWVYFL